MVKKVPPIICYRLTRLCNLHCNFCFASEKIKELSTEQVKTSISLLKEHGMKEIRLCGGEPTVRHDLTEILLYCFNLDLTIRICSNLYNIADSYDSLLQLPIGINTSIHGPSEYHNNITGIPNSYEKTTLNISKLLQNGKDVNVHTVLTKQSEKYAEELILKLIGLGIRKVTFQTFIPRERGIALYYTNPPEEVLSSLEKIQQLSVKYQSMIRIKTIDLYKKFYYVFEPDGYLYLQKAYSKDDLIIGRII